LNRRISQILFCLAGSHRYSSFTTRHPFCILRYESQPFNASFTVLGFVFSLSNRNKAEMWLLYLDRIIFQKPYHSEILNRHGNREQTMSVDNDSSKPTKDRLGLRKVRCPLCGEELPTYSDYRQHVKTRHYNFYLESRKGTKTMILAVLLMGVLTTSYVTYFMKQPLSLLSSFVVVLMIISIGAAFYTIRRQLLLFQKYKETLDLLT
jgi:uncharacterized C2H2 Zn-finger protein